MTEKNAEKKYIERFKNDYAFRTFFFSAVSLITGAAYAAYNLFLGLAYSSAWNTVSRRITCRCSAYVFSFCLRKSNT